MLLVRKILHKLCKKSTKACYSYPPGHYHSPIIDKTEISKRKDSIWDFDRQKIQTIDLNEENQIELLENFKSYYKEIPFTDQKSDNLRYYFKNNFYKYSDAIFLYCVMRHFKPSSIIEVGSGFSSAIMLDTSDIYFNSQIQCQFIEPYPERLIHLLKKNDKQLNLVKKVFVQDMDISFFDRLKENDILFIDSSHVSKTGSDVNHIFFNVLPRLNSGVIVHFHDVFYPFEYPGSWVMGGRSWNEVYLLRAFLSYNRKFEIVAFNTLLTHYHRDWFSKNMPLCLKDTGGSIWLKKNNCIKKTHEILY